MTLLGPDMLDTWVALDLATTGPSPERDDLLEVAAVVFQGDRVVDAFASLVYSDVPLPPEVARRTGLRAAELRAAPAFGQAASRLMALLAGHPIVAADVPHTLAFLSARGVRPAAPVCDLHDLAAVVLPGASDVSPAGVARVLGVPGPRPGRADAEAVRRLFLALLERLAGLDSGVLGFLGQVAARSGWSLQHVLRRVEARRGQAGAVRARVGPLGLDTEALRQRMGRVKALAARPTAPMDVELLAGLLAPGGALARVLPNYEHRPQQAEMLRAVATALRDGHHLVVEGGTGIGKTVAYLLPAIVYAVNQGKRVVVSTNTIGLQEQLMRKDIPALVQALEEARAIPRGEFKAVQLKGRANYLCLRRWSLLARGDGLGPAEARLLGRTLVWLQETATGDRAELGLSGRDAALWGRLAADQGRCPAGEQQDACFVRASRERAEGAHLVVVNHALLLTDLANGGNVIPAYQRLIVDEAHHLEDEATRQLGYELSQGRLDDLLSALGRTLDQARVVYRGQLLRPGVRAEGEAALQAVEEHLPAARSAWARLWGLVAATLLEAATEAGARNGGFQLRITESVRGEETWARLSGAWEEVDLALAEGARRVERLSRALQGLKGGELMDVDLLAAEAQGWLEEAAELRERLGEFVVAPEPSRVYWMTQWERGDAITLAAAPLHVGPDLRERLFSRVESVVLTSATLASSGGFRHLRERIGLDEAEELLVGSPFDFKRAALLQVPLDIPDPDRPGYQQALLQAVTYMASALGGHTMVLFTSHAALQGAARALAASGALGELRVLAQGVHGAPQQLMAAFQEDPRAVLLGTASFWEGVDLAEGVLRCLVLAKLPFNVPTEPVFAARSEQYENPFNDYAVPQAVLRFRQGFGRLVRRKGDRGVVLVMDRRLLTRGYGRTFLTALPDVTLQKGPLERLLTDAVAWLRNGAGP